MIDGEFLHERNSPCRPDYSAKRTVTLYTPRSEPAVVETDADSFGFHRIRRDFMTQPAFEQHEVADLCRNDKPRTMRGLCVRTSWRRRHHSIETRIFEFDARGS